MKYILMVWAVLAVHFVSAQNQLYIPDTLSGNNYSLTIKKDSVSFFQNKQTHTIGFNGAYLGPTLILSKGDSITLSVGNQLDDTTTVHWHGLHVAAKNDGGPHTTILPGTTWSPSFKVRDHASTYWYHPHLHRKTAEHVMKGAAGMIIVRDAEERAINLPRSYGVDDFPIIIQSQELDTVYQINTRGMQDSIMLVNGVLDPVVNMPAQVVRLRILNASQERSYSIGFTGSKSCYVIGNDGGLLDAPVMVTRKRMAPGERNEILLDLTGMNGQTLYLMSYASEIPMGVQGGPTMPMPPGSPPMDSPLNGIDFNILKIQVVAPTSAPVTTIPSALITNTRFTANQANNTRPITFSADSSLVMDGPFYFNGLSFDMMRIDYRIPLNNIEIWELTNQTMVAHPFHIHDIQFYILDRNGNAPSAEESGRKDVILVEPYDTVRFITQFTTFADTTVPYMFHCHVLMHEDDGMMGQFVVTDVVNSTKKISTAQNIILYPNPAQNYIKIANTDNKLQEIKITDLSGKEIKHYKIRQNQFEISTEDIADGSYIVKMTMSDGFSYFEKIIIRH